MIKQRVGSFPIVEKKKLVGFISQKDILWAIVKKSAKDLRDIKVIDISRKKITTIRPKAPMEEALNKMKGKFQKLPVTQNGNLVGMLTVKDILSFKPEFYPEIEELSKIREESEKLNRIKKIKERISEGICEECGHQDWLYKFTGMLVCESCMNS
jgi:signal-transduction protein with cAMP-binding, CBS, and nucleotidyltransferase domain